MRAGRQAPEVSDARPDPKRWRKIPRGHKPAQFPPPSTATIIGNFIGFPAARRNHRKSALASSYAGCGDSIIGVSSL